MLLDLDIYGFFVVFLAAWLVNVNISFSLTFSFNLSFWLAGL